MNPIIGLWWRLHRGLIDPEIASKLSPTQRRTVFGKALIEQQRSLSGQVRLWGTAICACVLWVGLSAGPFRTLLKWASMHAGMLIPMLFAIAVGISGVLLGWWLSRRIIARGMYKAVRGFGYDLCPQCGYWLRGLTDDTRDCPECGLIREAFPSLREECRQ